MNRRVQIPAYTDRWMMGDRYGEVVRISKSKLEVTNSLKQRDAARDIATVLLDKSGKTIRVLLADCTEV